MPSPSPSRPPVLPISEHEDEIVAAVEANPVIVVIGETGSGKSTQLSQILHRRGYTRRGAIAVTQPRRVAAVSVCRCSLSPKRACIVEFARLWASCVGGRRQGGREHMVLLPDVSCYHICLPCVLQLAGLGGGSIVYQELCMGLYARGDTKL